MCTKDACSVARPQRVKVSNTFEVLNAKFHGILALNIMAVALC